MDVQCSVIRLHCPEVDSKAKDVENCRHTMQPTRTTIETIFRITVSANQLSLYRAIAEICEEYETLHERTVRPDMVMGQSIVLSENQDRSPLDCHAPPAYQNFLLQQYGERIEKLSQQDKLSKFCMDAGFLSVVENGQYFMTKDTAEFSQFHAVACREYTLPREEAASQPKGWLQGNTWNTRKDSRKHTGRSSVLEMKRRGMELFLVHLKGSLQPLKWWNESKRPVNQNSRVLSVL